MEKHGRPRIDQNPSLWHGNGKKKHTSTWKNIHYYLQIAGRYLRTLKLAVLGVLVFLAIGWFAATETRQFVHVLLPNALLHGWFHAVGGTAMCQVAGKETSKPSAPPACSDVKVPCMGRWRNAQSVRCTCFYHVYIYIYWIFVLLFLKIILSPFVFAKVVCFQHRDTTRMLGSLGHGFWCSRQGRSVEGQTKAGASTRRTSLGAPN